MKTITIVGTLLCAVVSIIAFVSKGKITIPTQPPSEQEKLDKYTFLLSNRQPKAVKEGYWPVFIFRDPEIESGKLRGVWRASGTALVRNNEPKWITTAAHCFPTDGTYYAVIVSPYTERDIWGIESLGRYDGSNDFILAKVGPAQRIKGLQTSIPPVVRNQKVTLSSYETRTNARSLITGKEYTVLGTVKYEHLPAIFYLVDYSSTHAESGCGFEYGKEHLVFSQFLVLTEQQQKELRIKPRNGYFSAFLPTSIKWQ